MAERDKFYLTTAISYPNGPPHIGHAYEVIASDAIARFKRIDGYDVFFLTGTDEHGLKVRQTATREGKSPKAFVDEMASKFRAMGERLNCSFDRFIRTTDADHLASTQELWRRMQANGDIYLSKYTGWYSVRDEAYYDEGELTKAPDGSFRAPTGTPVEWIEEESYFFRLAAYQERLLAHYADNPDFIGPETRRNEIVSFVRGGLQDLSISRTTFDWGLPVPGDPKHVMYVWIDALNNYLTATGFPDESSPLRHYWPADVHVIGKDIVRFHTVYWPAFLMSAGLPCRSASSATASCSTAARRCRSPSATSSTRSRSPTLTASTSCATSSCARCRSARTATIRTRRSSPASTPISRTISATSPSARCR